jgi:hypothetical protein
MTLLTSLQGIEICNLITLYYEELCKTATFARAKRTFTSFRPIGAIITEDQLLSINEGDVIQIEERKPDGKWFKAIHLTTYDTGLVHRDNIQLLLTDPGKKVIVEEKPVEEPKKPQQPEKKEEPAQVKFTEPKDSKYDIKNITKERNFLRTTRRNKTPITNFDKVLAYQRVILQSDYTNYI